MLHVDGYMNEPEFYKAMLRLRINHSHYHYRRSQILDRWFREMFPDPVEDDNLWDRIIRYLKSERGQ